MAQNSKIEWTTHTFNMVWGCTKVSPGCDHCYAETLSNRYGHACWGRGAPRRTFGEKHWAEPLKWNRAAEKAGIRARVFCGSMCDWADPEAPPEEREKLWPLIRATPALDWLLLTKRPNLIPRYLPTDWGAGYPNVWMGTSVESQQQVWRIDKLVRVPAVIRFLSCEPLLGPLDLSRWIGEYDCMRCGYRGDECSPHDYCQQCGDKLPEGGDCEGCGSGAFDVSCPQCGAVEPEFGTADTNRHLALQLHWIIIGGESGPGARPFDLQWGRDLVRQCQVSGTTCFVKQLGSNPILEPGPISYHCQDLKGGDIAEFPADLRIRQMPAARA